jgi:2-hydroxy-6-oxonona-2,4-dienedioate hydrolase
MHFQYSKVANVNVRYYVTESKGDPVLLIHGLGGSIESWQNNIEAISSHQFRVIALDLPGFGLSDKPNLTYDIKYYSKFILDFITKLKLNTHCLSVIGNSLGGQIAAELAINHPPAVSKLVLLSPAGTLPVSFKATPALRKYLNVINATTEQQVRNALLAIDTNAKHIDREYAKMFFQRLVSPGVKKAFMSAYNGSARAPRLNKRLHKINAKTLLIWGKDDQVVPVDFLHPFIRMKNCRVILLENHGHALHMNNSMLFNKIVIDFLEE